MAEDDETGVLPLSESYRLALAAADVPSPSSTAPDKSADASSNAHEHETARAESQANAKNEKNEKNEKKEKREKKRGKVHPLDKAIYTPWAAYVYVSFSWLSSFMRTGAKRPLELDDMWFLAEGDKVKACTDKLEKQWEKQLKRGDKGSFFKAYWAAFGTAWIFTSLGFFAESVLQVRARKDSGERWIALVLTNKQIPP
jgi:Flp pilus assembly protein TadB